MNWVGVAAALLCMAAVSMTVPIGSKPWWAESHASPSSLNLPQLSILSFGGVGDGVTDNTVAFKNAIKQCQTLGGCTLIFPAPGQFVTAPVNITSNMVLQVQTNASIVGSEVMSAWPLIPPFPSYCQGRDSPGDQYAPLIGGYNLTDVHITGGGTIDGRGQMWWQMHKNGTLPNTPGMLLSFQYCQRLEISNLVIKDSPFWTVHPIYSNNVWVHDCLITAPADSSNTDGCDPDSSSNVLVEDCTIHTGDDNIAVKSGWDYCGRKFGMPSVNITVRNCYFPYGHGMAVGSETSGSVHNVSFVNNRLGPGVEQACHVKSGPGRGGIVSDIFYINNTFEVVQMAIRVDMNYTNNPPTNISATPIFKNLFENNHGKALKAGYLDCLDKSKCFLCLSNVTIDSILGYDCQNVAGQNITSSPPLCIQYAVNTCKT